ncbi:MAG: hypothetical protein HKP55_06245 [Gammaproteobacteria bacterium]|nr:hypothetical protein [Gammaproteobacteria bacterium]
MTREYEVQRYGSYFRGWCQAFGLHESVLNEKKDSYWLFSEHQVGFLLKPQLRRLLLKNILRKRDTPILSINKDYAHIGSFYHEFVCAGDKQGYDAIKKILNKTKNSYLYLTSHFTYGTDARILTLSSVKPMYILYKEIGCISVMLD